MAVKLAGQEGQGTLILPGIPVRGMDLASVGPGQLFPGFGALRSHLHYHMTRSSLICLAL